MQAQALGGRLSRRAVVGGLAGLSASAGGLALLSSACELLPTRIQPRVPHIGYLSFGPREASDVVDPFLEGLRDLGYIDGRTVSIEWRFTPTGSDARFAELAAELVQAAVDVIVSITTAPSVAARQATTSIPIVAVSVAQPVETGLVASLARPGANLTALAADTGPEFHAKSLDLLRDVVPTLTRVAGLVDIANPANGVSWEFFRKAAEQVGLRAERVDLHSADELEMVFETETVRRAELVFNAATPLLNPVRGRLAELALQLRLPAFSVVRSFADTGLLMSYGPNYPAINRRAASVVDKILHGAKPADLPVEQPSVFELVVNRTTAEMLSLTIPPDVAAQVTDWVS